MSTALTERFGHSSRERPVYRDRDNPSETFLRGPVNGGEVAFAERRANVAEPSDRLESREPATPAPSPLQPAAEPSTTPGPVSAEAPPASPAPAKRSRLKPMLLAGVLAVAAIGGGYYGYNWWTVGRFMVSTDDAYVGAKNATLAAKIPGYVARIAFEDNAQVHAGDVIATIDDGDYKLAVEAARGKAETQQATIERLDKQIVAQQAALEQTKAQLVSARAAAVRAQQEFDRQQALSGRGFASKQAFEQAQAGRDQANAMVQSAQAAIDAAAANVDVSRGQREEAARLLKELQTALAKAERDLSFTVLRAPFDGVVGNRAMQVGDYVQAGQRLASLVPLDAVYVDANFKETQLAKLRGGQTATITVDALPGEPITAMVESVAPASGSVFSLLPPDNATGNFTKIVQRVPVRIRVPAEIAARGALRPGMSVVVSVNTKLDAQTKTAQAPAISQVK
jgi:membrane fusion protein (multidrug efflux system)